MRVSTVNASFPSLLECPFWNAGGLGNVMAVFTLLILMLLIYSVLPMDSLFHKIDPPLRDKIWVQEKAEWLVTFWSVFFVGGEDDALLAREKANSCLSKSVESTRFSEQEAEWAWLYFLILSISRKPAELSDV